MSLRVSCFLICALALLAVASPARASVVLRLDAEALREGASVIVDGEVLSVSSRWNSERTGLETVIEFSVMQIRKGAPSRVVEIVQPGGEVAGDRQVIVGMPVFRVGEVARLFLRESGPGRYRVYGWWQGLWPGQAVGSAWRFPSRPLATNDWQEQAQGLSAAAPLPFEPNGLIWPQALRPVEYQINDRGSDNVPFSDVKRAVMQAFSTWQEVACSSLSYRYAGDTALRNAVDGINVILFIERDWAFGEEAAGVTSLFFPAGQDPTADVALNGQNFSWNTGTASVGPESQDIQAVMTHELGHFSGLSHTQSALDTMYYSWTPWQSQRSLSADDKLGLCAIYPQEGDECATNENCASGAECRSFSGGRLCSPRADPLGAECNYNKVECEFFCLYTKADLSEGYCSKFCDEAACPDGFLCQDASLAADSVRVCFVDPNYVPPPPCSGSASCALGKYCDQGTGMCKFDCREDIDCNDAAFVCGEKGKCEPAPHSSGCGCSSGVRGGGSGSPAAPVSCVVVLALLAAWSRYCHNRRSRVPRITGAF